MTIEEVEKAMLLGVEQVEDLGERRAMLLGMAMAFGYVAEYASVEVEAIDERGRGAYVRGNPLRAELLQMRDAAQRARARVDVSG